jgi:GDPmannose 4,6-dehydratase
VLGTGETHSVREFVDVAFDYAGLDPKARVKIDKRYFRPTEVDVLIADASKAKRELGFKPRVKFIDLVKIMVDADMRASGLEPIGEGDKLVAKKFPSRWWGAD